MRFDSHLVKAVLAIAIMIAVLVFAFVRETPGAENPVFTGETMGTTYTIKLARSPLTKRDLATLQKRINGTLQRIMNQMSTYNEESEISQFNRHNSTEPFEVSADFDFVVRSSLDLARRSNGAFDPTVAPLVSLWGFGPDGESTTTPSPKRVEEAGKLVGYGYLSQLGGHKLKKAIGGLQLDLGAVAKGYAVDDVGRLLLQNGVTNFMVEIGGETVVWGRNADDVKWRIGVQRPDIDAVQGEDLQGILHVSGVAIATSGDYRRYSRGAGGQFYPHIIDPRTAKPVSHKLASVTVVGRRCMIADALATALFVLGPNAGMPLVASYSGTEALFIVRNEDGSFTEIASSGFRALTEYESYADQKGE
jgi:thiamine biosynthesis lipoprotein